MKLIEPSVKDFYLTAQLGWLLYKDGGTIWVACSRISTHGWFSNTSLKWDSFTPLENTSMLSNPNSWFVHKSLISSQILHH